MGVLALSRASSRWFSPVWRGQCCLAGLSKTCRQLGKITSLAEELAVCVDHLDIHLQVTFNLLGKTWLKRCATPIAN